MQVLWVLLILVLVVIALWLIWGMGQQRIRQVWIDARQDSLRKAGK